MKDLAKAFLRGAAGGALIALLLILAHSHDVEASDFCSDFREGYKDGYCSTQNYVCYGPPFYPVCYSPDYQSSREAYHVGYDRGRRDR